MNRADLVGLTPVEGDGKSYYRLFSIGLGTYNDLRAQRSPLEVMQEARVVFEPVAHRTLGNSQRASRYDSRDVRFC